MPRGGRSAGYRPMSTTSRAAPAAAPAAAAPAHSQASAAPAHAPAAAAPAPAPVTAPVAAGPKQPGLFAQMATTAAGVAVGSTIGHVAGAAITNSFSGSNNKPAETQPAVQPAPVQRQEAPVNAQNPCEFEMNQFVDCAQNHSDMSLCQGFNDALKQCRAYYNKTSQPVLA